MPRLLDLALGAILAASLPAAAMAEAGPRTRLVSCQSGNCLQVSGHRANPAAAVLINGHAVAVHGKRNWRVHLPVETIRAWSEPFARSVDVAVFDPATQRRTSDETALPIGLLGNVTSLASLVISVK